jgi:hypothetical protein
VGYIPVLVVFLEEPRMTEPASCHHRYLEAVEAADKALEATAAEARAAAMEAYAAAIRDALSKSPQVDPQTHRAAHLAAYRICESIMKDAIATNQQAVAAAVSEYDRRRARHEVR